MSSMQTSKWQDKTLFICNLHIRGCGKANTLMSACWPQFRTVKQKNLIMFSVDGRGLWLGASDQPEASDLCQSETEFQTSILNFSDSDSWRQMWGSSKTNKYCQKHNSFLFYLCSCLAKMKSNQIKSPVQKHNLKYLESKHIRIGRVMLLYSLCSNSEKVFHEDA